MDTKLSAVRFDPRTGKLDHVRSRYEPIEQWELDAITMINATDAKNLPSVGHLIDVMEGDQLKLYYFLERKQ